MSSGDESLIAVMSLFKESGGEPVQNIHIPLNITDITDATVCREFDFFKAEVREIKMLSGSDYVIPDLPYRHCRLFHIKENDYV